LFARGQRDDGLQVLKLAHNANPNAIDAAEIKYLEAAAAGDAESRGKALETLTQLEPANAGRFRELAALRFAQRRFDDAARSYEAMTRMAPDEADGWNQLGYSYALAGDLTKARHALEEYRRMSGAADSNALDSLGEVHFFAGDFSSAEKYFAAAQKDPARRGDELMKQAEARLMTGDLAGADTIFQQYLRLIQPSQGKAASFELAQWEFLTGRRKAGMAWMEQLIPGLAGDAKSFALSQLAIWKLQTGIAGAAEAAGEAMRSAETAGAVALSSTVQSMAEGKAGFNTPLAEAHALLAAKKYSEAIHLLETVYRGTNPTVDGQVRTLLAWAYVEAKRIGDARKLVETYPIPLSSGDRFFASLAFPRFLEVRSAVLADAGKAADAKRLHELFVKYSGDAPDAFMRARVGSPN
jgi:tetratricopeptide (TPR) repeat protein